VKKNTDLLVVDILERDRDIGEEVGSPLKKIRDDLQVVEIGVVAVGIGLKNKRN